MMLLYALWLTPGRGIVTGGRVTALSDLVGSGITSFLNPLRVSNYLNQLHNVFQFLLTSSFAYKIRTESINHPTLFDRKRDNIFLHILLSIG